MQWISKNHRINNIRKGDLGQDRFTDLTEQMDQGKINLFRNMYNIEANT